MTVKIKNTVGELLKNAFAHVFGNFKSVLFLCASVLAVGIILSLLSGMMPDQQDIIDGVSGVVQAIIMISVAVRWYRIEMGDAPMKNTIFVFDGQRWFKMLWAQILIVLVCFIPGAILAVLVVTFLGGNYVAYGIATLVGLVTIYVWHRLPFLLLYAATGQKISLKNTWKESHSVWVRLLATNLVLYIGLMIVVFVLSLGFFFAVDAGFESVIFWGAPILSILVNFSYLLLFMLNASIIAQLYREIK